MDHDVISVSSFSYMHAFPAYSHAARPWSAVGPSLGSGRTCSRIKSSQRRQEENQDRLS